MTIVAAFTKSANQFDTVGIEAALGAAFLGMAGHDGALELVRFERKIRLHRTLLCWGVQ